MVCCVVCAGVVVLVGAATVAVCPCDANSVEAVWIKACHDDVKDKENADDAGVKDACNS